MIGALVVDLGLASSQYVRSVPVSMFSLEEAPEVLARIEADRAGEGFEGALSDPSDVAVGADFLA